MALQEDDLVEYLRHKRRTWTERAVAELAADPAGLKAEAEICQQCSQPCQNDEICITAVVDDRELLDGMQREQAFHLIEDGMARLRWVDEISVREVDDTRPNTFVKAKDELEE